MQFGLAQALWAGFGVYLEQGYQWLKDKILSEEGRRQQAKLKELQALAERLGCTLPQLAIGNPALVCCSLSFWLSVCLPAWSSVHNGFMSALCVLWFFFPTALEWTQRTDRTKKSTGMYLSCLECRRFIAYFVSLAPDSKCNTNILFINTFYKSGEQTKNRHKLILSGTFGFRLMVKILISEIIIVVSVHPSIFFICLYAQLSIFSYVCLLIYLLSIVYQAAYPSIHPSVSLCVDSSIHLSVCLLIHPYICQSAVNTALHLFLSLK